MKKTKQQPTKDLTADVMSAIKKGEVTMRPKAYFIVGSLLLGAGLAVAFTMAFFFLTASAFHIRDTGPIGFLRYGGVGAPIFIRLFPWKPLILAIAGIGGGLWLLKKYDVSYKKNFALISLALIGALVVFAVTFDRLGAHDRLQKTPRFAMLYRQNIDREHVVRGKIIEVRVQSLMVEEIPTQKKVEIVWDKKTIFPRGADFAVGDIVSVIGEWEQGFFKAKGMHAMPSPRVIFKVR